MRNGGFFMTDAIQITGGVPLRGTAQIPAAKNSVLPLLAASVLCRGPVCLRRVPLLSDVKVCLELLAALGVSASMDGSSVYLDASAPVGYALGQENTAKMRASVLFLAPVLARCGRVEAGLPGGCRLGARPIDIHLDGLEKMGASVRWRGDRLILSAPRGLSGMDYRLRCPSVGATETLLLAAATARGVTILRGAAQEPEIRDLAAFLNRCGAKIQGAGSDTIRIAGVRVLSGCVHTPIPDRIIAATLACAVASAGGWARLAGCCPDDFAPVLALLQKAGCQIVARPDGCLVRCTGRLQGIGSVQTGAYPAFPTDAAPLLAAALLGAKGETCIEDTVFENRFACAQGFAVMGAKVDVQGPRLSITGTSRLCPARVCAPDLRGGAALAIAALAAPGTTQITGTDHIARGYPDLAGQLAALGARALATKV